MNRHSLVVFSACALLTLGACQTQTSPQQGETSVPLDDLQAQASYGLGLNIGSTFVEQAINIDLNPEALIQGLRDGLEGTEPRLSEEQMTEALLQFQQQLAIKQDEIFQAVGNRFLEEGRKFLEENASNPGVQTLPSGLQYQVLQEGEGPIPKAEDSVYLRYLGRLTNGTVIEDSEDFGGTVAVAVAEVIEGWQEALQLMKVGSKWEIFIPSELAYGAKALPDRLIPPNAVLIYEIELLEIVPKE